MAKPLNEWTATEIVAGIEARTTSAEKVVEACLERIAARDGEVAAWAFVDADLALRYARESDCRGAGPLRGVPFGAKDIIDSFDMPTEWGTPIHKGRMPARDAACIALSRKAGGILLGKTVTTEFANLHPGATRNPRDTSRSPGGSSSGSAAAVADNMIPLAIGTQTTGSTIRPSSFCGIFGYRPTYGEHRLHGVMEASGSLDTLGICARSVEDIALYRDVLLGIPPVALDREAPAPRIGLCRTHIWDQVEPTIQRRTEETAERLGKAGAVLSDVELPAAFRALTEAHQTISSFEFARTFTDEIERHHDGISDTLRGGRIAAGLSVSFEDYIAAQMLADRCRTEMYALFDAYDVLLTPSATGEAPVGWNAFSGADLYKMWTVLHVPALSLPVFTGAAGMPAGVQLFARRHSDRRLFAAADWAWRALAG